MFNNSVGNDVKICGNLVINAKHMVKLLAKMHAFEITQATTSR